MEEKQNIPSAPPSYYDVMNSENQAENIDNKPTTNYGMNQEMHVEHSDPQQSESPIVMPIGIASPPPQPSPPQQLEAYQTQPLATGPPVNYGAINPSSTVQPIPTEIVIINGCPVCHIGMLEDDYTPCGLCCAICFFPLGVICCLLSKQKKCSNCGAEF